MKDRTDPAVDRDLDAQEAALTRRVAASGLYMHEPAEFVIARRAHARLVRELGVARDLGSLTTPESRNVVRRVVLDDGTPAVLKVAGHDREPGEGEALELWYRHGLPTARPLAYGLLHLEAPAAVATYLLTEFLPARPLSPDDLAGKDRRREVVRRVGRTARRFHLSEDLPPRRRTWAERLLLHAEWTLPLLVRAGLEAPADFASRLAAASADGVLLHGDPAGGNVLRRPTGEVLLIDPPGAVTGPPEADFAQLATWAATAHAAEPGGGVEDLPELVDLLAADHPDLDPALLRLFAGANLVTLAGYFLVGHAHPSASAEHDHAAAREAADRYLTRGREWIDESS